MFVTESKIKSLLALISGVERYLSMHEALCSTLSPALKNNIENFTILRFDVETVPIVLISSTPLKRCFEDCEDC